MEVAREVQYAVKPKRQMPSPHQAPIMLEDKLSGDPGSVDARAWRGARAVIGCSKRRRAAVRRVERAVIWFSRCDWVSAPAVDCNACNACNALWLGLTALALLWWRNDEPDR